MSIDYSQRAAQFIEEAGGEAIFCQSDVGHKVASPCFKQMEIYFNGKKPKAPALAGTEQRENPQQEPDSGNHGNH